MNKVCIQLITKIIKDKRSTYFFFFFKKTHQNCISYSLHIKNCFEIIKPTSYFRETFTSKPYYEKMPSSIISSSMHAVAL